MTPASSFCNDIAYLCVTLSAGSGATYTDSDTSSSSNEKCLDISTRITCAPGNIANFVRGILSNSGFTTSLYAREYVFLLDPSVASFSIDTSNLAFQQDVPLSIDISIEIVNKATGTYDDIKSTSGLNYNFAFELQLTDRNLQLDGSADTTIPTVTPALTDSERQRGLAKGEGTPTFHVSVGSVPSVS